jgi:YegS/Rv2252/BmrU family lipid kinase
MDKPAEKVLVIFNPKAGKENQSSEIRLEIAKHFNLPQWAPEIYETTGKENVTAICRAACERGTSLVIAAGGDGTVADVANGLVHSQVPLGILPLGTGNDLARALSVPLQIDEALDMLSGDNVVVDVDAMRVGERYFFSNVSVGMSPQVMNDTKGPIKKRFGRLAYIWTMVKKSDIFHLHHYKVTVDGQSVQSINASEILVSNTTLLEAPPHVFGPADTLNDNQFEVYMVTAKTWGDFIRLMWDMVRRPGHSAVKLSHLVVKDRICIDTIGSSHLAQADGEVIGHTPLEIQLVPKALHVVMPKPNPELK